MHHPARVWLVVISLILTATGCASFPAYRVPKIQQPVSHAGATNKPSAHLALRWIIDMSGGSNPGVESTAQLPTLRSVVEKVAQESLLFSSYTFEAFQARNTDYVVQMDLTNHGSAGKAAGAGFITGLTLFVIPTAATDNYKLVAKVYDREGKILKTYTYDDAVTTWFGIWLLPLAGNTPHSAAVAVLENMVRTLFRDVHNDGLLRPTS